MYVMLYNKNSSAAPKEALQVGKWFFFADFSGTGSLLPKYHDYV